jgi:integrase
MKDIIDEFFELTLIDNSTTKRSYRCHIKKYMEINGQNPNTYFKQKQPYEEHIKNYWEYLKGKSPSSRNVGISSVKGFLKRFDKTTKTLDIWDDITARMKGTTSVPVTPKHVPDRDELRTIFQYCDIRTKTAVMMSITSGCRIGEITKLEPDDIYFDQTPTKINIRPEVSKNNRRRITFISPEATQLLKEWLRVREEYTKNSLKRMNFHYQQHLKNKVDNRIFPVNQFNIRRQFNIACDKAGFSKKHKQKGDFDNKVKRNRRELTFHHLRDFFRTYLGNTDLAEHLMGHSGYLSTYRQYNDKELSRLYMENIHNVTIFERQSDLTDINKQLEELRKENEEMKKQIIELRLEKLERVNGLKK